MKEQITATQPRHRLQARSIVGWIISILCLGLIAWKVDLAGAVAAMQRFALPYLVVSIVSLTFGYSLRIVRWSWMLQAAGSRVRTSSCIVPFLGSIALNNLLPLRAGDIVRATVFPTAIGVDRTAALGSIVIERLLDLLTLVILLGVGATVIPNVVLPHWLVQITIIVSFTAVAALVLIFLFSGSIARALYRYCSLSKDRGFIVRTLQIVARMLEGFRHMSQPRSLAKIVVLSLLVWLGEAGAFYAIMLGFGMQQPPAAALLVMSFITLSTLVPSSPGYIGPFHLAAFSVIVLLNVNEEVATSFAVLSHLVLWVSTTAAGGIAMLVHPAVFRTKH